MVRLTFPNGEIREVSDGIKYSEIVPPQSASSGNPVVAVKVDNEILNLCQKPERDATVEFVRLSSHDGAEVYRRSVGMILGRAILETTRNARLIIGHSIGNGYYYDYHIDTPVSERITESIERKMREIVEKNEPIYYDRMSKQQAIDLFRSEAYSDKVRLLKHLDLEEVGVYRCGKYIDLSYGPVVPNTGYCRVFKLRPYGKEGFVLCFPDRHDPKVPSRLEEQRKLFRIHKESKQWGQILEVNNLGRLNDIIARGEIAEYIKIAESLHARKISEIADMIAKRSESVKVVLIAGPSSSGKTTFSKRLDIELRVHGLRPYALSLDNYFVDREHTPRDEQGNYDFEALHCLDIDLFNQHLVDLLKGKEVDIPKFDFEKGKRKKGYTLQLDEDQILIIEGIHGLNEELTHAVPSENKFKIYASALTQLSLDDYNRISTTDTRYIRRMVRDAQFRGYSARETISRWPSVKRGEARNIFPFQEEADAMFNSAVVYEMSVLRPHVEPLLLGITKDMPEYMEAHRLHRFIRLFTPIPADDVPKNSILREFIGGSWFNY